MSKQRMGIPITLSFAITASFLYRSFVRGDIEKTPMDRLGQNYLLLPIVIAIFLFLIIEYSYISHRTKYKEIDPPSLAEQISYLDEIYNFTIRYNKGTQWTRRNQGEKARNKKGIPYFKSIFSCVFAEFIVLPLVYFLYLQPSTDGKFILLLLVLDFLIYLIP